VTPRTGVSTGAFGGIGAVDEGKNSVQLTDEQRLDWLRLIRSQNVGPRGIADHGPFCA
jgi:hypothetical protein